MKRAMRLFLVGGSLLLVAAVLAGVLLCLPHKKKLSLAVEGEGKVLLSGAAAKSLYQTQEKFFLSAGETLSFATVGGQAFWTVDGMRFGTLEEFDLTMPEHDLSISASFAEQASFDPLTPDVVVFEAEELGANARRPFFPSVTQAADGTILVVYYYADGHALYNQYEGKLSGVLQLVRSTDGGATWSEPETLVDLTDEDPKNGDFNREARDPNLQRLSDGTLLLTFPVRAPIGKAGLNTSSGAMNDYWSERSYYMTSRDNGVTWSEMREIECDYFSHGEPFLYDDATRTTGCWVKNGSVAELASGELLFPLYGAEDCASRGDYTGVCVKAKNNGDGTLTFLKDGAETDGKARDAALILPRGQGNEIALTASRSTVYALARTGIPSATDGGVLYRSEDGGATWDAAALEATENDCLNQPNFCTLGGDLVLMNYSVPLASVYDSPARRTARPVYGKLFNVKTGKLSDYEAAVIYDTATATVADMGNPSSVLLSDGRIMTVYYDTSAPAARRGFIGATFTVLSDYLKGSEASAQETLSAFLGG